MTRKSAEWHGLTEESRTIVEKFQKEIPVRVGDLARELGLIVKVSTLDVGISGLIRPENSTFKILVNKHEPSYRRRFTLAHEISHYLLHRDMIGDGISDNILYRSRLSDSVEAEANRLASDILMPPIAIDDWKRRAGEMRPADMVSPMAAYFDVSEEAMRIRLGMKK
jgi:Zn-dependent peptidase ImmA (M78 family)